MPKPSAATSTVRRGNRPTDHKTGDKGTPMEPLASASLIILCPVRSANGTLQYETLMLQRSARDGSSFRSAVVFPGGALDLADETPFLARSSPDQPLTPEEEVKAPPMTFEKDGDRFMAALRLCALRETFEETGLLLIPSPAATNETNNGHVPLCRAIGHKDAGLSKEEWAAVREEVHNDASVFPRLLARIAETVADPYKSPPKSHGSSSRLPPLAAISYHTRWITPRSVVRPGKRFDAFFFLTVLDEIDVFGRGKSTSASGSSSSPIEVSADGTETTDLRLATSIHFVEEALRDRFVLFPPQFYILADLASATSGQRGLAGIEPLNFGRTPEGEAAKRLTSSSEGRVTPMEEEARGLEGRNYAWERKSVDSDASSKKSGAERPQTSWVSYSQPPFHRAADGRIQADLLPSSVTAIEPRALPSAGANVSINVPSNNASGQWERVSEDEPFTFPLCLPGDQGQSRAQAAVAGLPYPAPKNSHKAENRVFVSPRLKSDGGGLVVRGIRRRGIPGTRDFQFGTVIEVTESKADDDAEEEESKPSRSKL